MSLFESLYHAGEYFAAGLFEEPARGLFYRKALGLRRYFETAALPPYTGGHLYPSGGQHFDTNLFPHYLTGFKMNREALDEKVPGASAAIDSEFDRYHTSVPWEHSVAGNMYTHSMPNYARIAAEGFESYLPRIEKIADADLRGGLSHLLAGIRTYVKRCADYLQSAGADQALIDALRRLPFMPARTIYEAIVCRNFLFYLDNCDNLGCVASDLMPYYNGEDVTELLCELFDNCDITGGYSMSLGVDYSPLTVQCLRAVKGKRRPMMELFIDENCPDEVWDAALDAVRSSGGQPAFYSYRGVIGGLHRRFPQIPQADLDRFCGGGCTESMLAGLSNVGSLDAGINLPLILTRTIAEKLADSADFEEFHAAFIADVSAVVDTVTREIAASQKERALHNPLPMRTLLIDDCIDNGLDFNNGGARYMWSIINFAGTINIIDAMLVIDDYIFRDKTMSAAELIQRLANGDEALLHKMRHHPVCFGVDDPRANAMASRISGEIFSLLDDKMPHFGLGFLPASIQFCTAADAGKQIGATPDGRCAGAPLCESLGAISGKDVKGTTALLGSVTSLALDKALGIPVVNLTVNPAFDNGILRSLIESYMDMGGMHLQLTCTSREMLEEAMADPDRHRNLVIRVGGYSEYFHRLSDDLKKLVLSRTIH